jgi:hypothetical protein
MEKNFSIKSFFLLAVEGKDECNFYESLLKHQNISNVQLVDIGGKDKFNFNFPALYNLDGFNKIKRLGFVRDAENNQAQSAFNSICDLLKKHQLPVPTQPNTIINTSEPQIGIFIMPDNAGTGMLEDLCLSTIKTNPVNTCITNFVDCFLKHQNEKEKDIFNISKACVQAYLATRSPIKNSLGLGAKSGYWDFTNPCFDTIKSFLSALYK